MNSPQSQKLTVGSMVIRYVMEAVTRTMTEKIRLIRVNFFCSICRLFHVYKPQIY